MAENNSEYPKRMGQPWGETETTQLLKEVREKLEISEIAERHGRTDGGITARLRTLAWEYHSKGRSLEEIMKFTGLDGPTITKTITRHQLAAEAKFKKTQKQVEKKQMLDMEDVVAILKDIQSMMKELVENTRPQKKIIIKKKPEYMLSD